MDTQTAQRSLKILLADDGSQHARAAVTLLYELLRSEKTEPRSSVRAVTVFTPRQVSDHEALRAALEQSRDLLHEKGIQAEAELLLGYPAEKLIEDAEQYRPDLIVMGAKGLRATMGILLGGVAQQVVEYSCCPVLVVRAPYTGVRRILLATDGSANSQLALDYLAGSGDRPPLPLPQGTDVRVLHVLPPTPTPVAVAGAWGWERDDLDASRLEPAENVEGVIEEECAAAELLDRAVETLRSAGLNASSLLRRGDAATEIIKYSQENLVDLIVAGCRGLSPVKAWLLGSISRKLVHYAGCSVLIVKSGQEGERT